MIKRREFIAGGCISGLLVCVSRAGMGATESTPESARLLSIGQMKGIIEALSFVGEPIPHDVAKHLLALAENRDENSAVAIEIGRAHV